MITVYFLVGVALAIPELVIVNNWPWLKRLLDRNSIIEIIFSLMLGVVVGAAMGIASGVTFAVGNVFATMITKVIYSLHLLERWKIFKHACTEGKHSVLCTWNEFSELIHFVWTIFMIPIRTCAFIMRLLNRAAAKANTVSARVSHR